MTTMPKTHAAMGQHMKQCIELCQQCYQVCSELLSSGLGRSTISSHEVTLRLLQDCAEICQVSANFMLRSSEFHTQTCGVCAAICLRCAEACEENSADSRLQHCADVCRQCAESCQLMMAMDESR